MSVAMYINSIVVLYLFLWAYDWYYNKMMYKKIQITVEKNLIYILTAILAIILEGNGNFVVKQIVMVTMYIIPILNYRIDVKDKIFYVGSNFILLALCDQLSYNLSSAILNVFNYKFVLTVDVADSIFYYIIMTYFVLLIYIIIFNIKRYINFINKIKLMIFNNYKILFNSIILVLFIYIILSYDFFQSTNIIIRISIFIMGSVITYINIDSIINYSKYKRFEEYTKNLILNIEGNISNINEYKIEKHNLNNFLLSLKSVDNINYNNLIDNYINNQQINNSSINIFNIPPNIAGFITNKMNQNKCKYFINGAEHLKDINISNPRLYNEVCSAIGVTLDNAYDAIKEKRKKEIIMNIEKVNNKTIISIYNLFDNNININEIGNMFYTTKQDGNGIGLYSIYNSKYIRFKISIINNYFKIDLIIKNAS